MLNIPYDKKKKQERMVKLIAVIENLFDKFTTNNQVIGYTILIAHILFVVISLIFLLYCDPTIVNIALLIVGCIAIHSINAYYSGGTPLSCVLLRLERHFFADKEHYGAINVIYKILGKPITKETQLLSEIMLAYIWLMIFAYIAHKIYQCSITE